MRVEGVAGASIKGEVVEFARSYYAKHGEVPSVRTVQREFRGLRFYTIFPGGIRQLCEESGLPIPASRIGSVSRALEARASRAKGADGLRRLEALLEAALWGIMDLYACLYCLGRATSDAAFMGLAEEGALELSRRAAEANPELAARLLRGDNALLECVSDVDEEWLEEHDPEGLERRRRWVELLRERCPDSEYLKRLRVPRRPLKAQA
jgi:hypothetical protein